MKSLNHFSKTTIAIIAAVIIGCAALITSCTASQKVSTKGGAQLWSENCQRCHNVPSPSAFSHEQWETIGLHMQSRALITEDERKKIVAFLQQ